MKTVTLKIGEKDTVINIVSSGSKAKILTASDKEMDRRVECAVKAAITKSVECHKPVARFNAKTGAVTLEQE